MGGMRILVAGDVRGKLPKIYERVEKLLSKGKRFDALFCVGDFFGEKRPTDDPEWMVYAKGLKRAPISTYVLGANNAQHANVESQRTSQKETS